MHERIFRWPNLLEEMLEKRRAGWSFPALAREFRCDVSTIYAQCKKHGVTGRVVLTVTMERKQTIPQHLYEDFDGELKIKPKSYKQYLFDKKERERRNFNERMHAKVQRQREQGVL